MNIATFHLTVRQQDTLQLREQPGSMLRGAFGHALRELACITDLPDCKQCPLNQTCQYTRIFETQLIQTHQNSQQSSNPYIIKLPNSQIRIIHATQTWTFGVTLLGQAIDNYALVLKAWQQAIELGFDNGSHRACGELIRVSNQTQTVFVANSSEHQLNIANEQIRRIVNIDPIEDLSKVTLHFLSPFRVQHQGKVAFSPNQFEPKNLLISLFNRIKQCNEQHDPSHQWQSIYTNFAEYLADIERITMDVDVSSVKVRRNSSRQNRKIELFGLIGDISLTADTDTLNRLLPLLWLGQYLHVGKNTTLGLGQYQLQLR